MIQVKDIHFSYRRNSALNGINWHVPQGSFASILGPNGSGKSTILKLIAGTLAPQGGEIRISGRSLQSYDRRAIARKVAYLPQKCEVPEFNVQEAILSGRHPQSGWFTSRRDMEIVENLIERFGLEKFALRPVATLSGGEFQKVTIARALAQEPELILLDEPTNHLDIRNQIDVADLLKTLAQELSLTVVSVFHDVNLAMRVSDRFLLLKEGQIVYDGDTDQVTDRELGHVYDVDMRMHIFDGRRTAIVTGTRSMSPSRSSE